MILARLLENGYPVSVPYGDNQRYDLVVELDGCLKKVQCKTGRIRHGGVSFNTHSLRYDRSRRNYRGDVDLFGVYEPTTREVYFVPVEDAPITEMRLRLEKPKSGNQHGIKLAENYLLKGI